MSISDYQPSMNLYNHVRAGFVAQGTTMGKWCRTNGVNPTNARACLVGVWDGPKGKALRSRLINAACMNVSSLDAQSVDQPKQRDVA